MQKSNKIQMRSVILSVAFAIACLIYIFRLINIQINATDDEDDGAYYTRRQTIQAVRGEIYDRNGKKLVSNKYTYDFVFDYSAMSGDKTEQNVHLLKAIYAMQDMGISDKLPEHGFPFDGEYPNYKYSDDVLSMNSDTYYTLLKRIAEFELEDESEIAKNELTADFLEGFYQSNPSAFPGESEILNFYLKRYGLVDSKGELVFTQKQTDTLLRLRYNMTAADFSVYNSYTLAQNVDKSFILYIEELSLPGADFEVRTERVYEYPGYALHILGYTGRIYAENWEEYEKLGYEMDDIVGIDGCEKAFEKYLRGTDGVMLIEEDENGNIISQKTLVKPVAGQDVYLTIDIDLQIAAEDGLKQNIRMYASSDSGAIVAMNPNSGEVLALASYPAYDQSTYNLALKGLYEPGSTFKLAMTALGIDSGIVGADELIECEGIKYQLRCWIHPDAHGLVDASKAICVSCNCYFYELGYRAGIEAMNAYCTLLGLGQKTGIELEEYDGELAGPADREENGGLSWNVTDTLFAAIGQSQNRFTPIQLASYVSTLLNGGTRYSATLLLKTSSFSEGGDLYVNQSKVLGNVDISDTALSTIKQGMKQMVDESSMAQSNGYFSNLPVEVGGKTGTAELGGNEKENGLFVCAAPYDKPEIIVTSVIANAGSGSRAMPSVAKVLTEYYLG